jgi:hypothetical protein
LAQVQDTLRIRDGEAVQAERWRAGCNRDRHINLNPAVELPRKLPGLDAAITYRPMAYNQMGEMRGSWNL